MPLNVELRRNTETGHDEIVHVRTHWGQVDGKPTTFAPTSHNHNTSDVNDGTLVIARGGTNIGTYAAGDILYASAANVLSKLAKGTDGHILKLASGLPAWAAESGGGGSGTVTSVAAGNGMSFTSITETGSVTLGTPGSLNGSSTNAVSASSHTHAVSLTATNVGAAPHSGTTNTAGSFNNGTTDPTATDRMNYAGILNASTIEGMRITDISTGTGVLALNATTHRASILRVRNSSGTRTFQIPLADTFPVGTEFNVFREGAGDVDFISATGTNQRPILTVGYNGTINTGNRKINAQYQSATLKKITTTTWMLVGALKA